MKFNLIAIIIFNFLIYSCSDNIISECEIDSQNIKINSTFSSIQSELFDKSCISCHSGSMPAGLLDLSSGVSYSNLLNKDNADRNMKLVVPNESANSYLLKKITANDNSIMPPSGKLPTSITDSVAKWIDNGALNN